MDKYANIGNYRQDADFCILVFEGVDWVPLNTLGKTRYTNAQMKEIAVLPLPERKSRIATLYEAVQLFILSGFRGAFDNEDVSLSGLPYGKSINPRNKRRRAAEGAVPPIPTGWLSICGGDTRKWAAFAMPTGTGTAILPHISGQGASIILLT